MVLVVGCVGRRRKRFWWWSEVGLQECLEP